MVLITTTKTLVIREKGDVMFLYGPHSVLYFEGTEILQYSELYVCIYLEEKLRNHM